MGGAQCVPQAVPGQPDSPVQVECLSCGGQGCSLCATSCARQGRRPTGAAARCVACSGEGCGLCKAAPARLLREGTCLACAGQGCSLCRDAPEERAGLEAAWAVIPGFKDGGKAFAASEAAESAEVRLRRRGG